MSRELIKAANKRLSALKSERTYMIEWWSELSDYHLNHRGRYLYSNDAHNNTNRRKYNSKVVNNKSRLAGRTLQGGLMAGITSPARPWFRLKTDNDQLMKIPPVAIWFHDVERLMRNVFTESNLYASFLSSYLELGVFGTSCIGIYEDFDSVIRTEVFTVGQYHLGTNGKNQVDTFYREYMMTAGQLIKEFGEDSVSERVRNMWKNGGSQNEVKVIHFVEPNDNRDMLSPEAKHKAFRSCYYEYAEKGQSKFLRESGFDEFPYLCPRWEVVGTDTYGTSCPGMDTLGDQKALQLREKEIGTAHHLNIAPPTQIPSSLQGQLPKGELRPGQKVTVDDTSTQGGARPIYEVRFDSSGMLNDVFRTEERIAKGFYEDLFLMLSNSGRSQITAREIQERHEEKLLMLGPVLERLHGELLDPLIKRTFAIMDRAGILPEIPKELEEEEINIEYVSVLAQAQKLATLSELDMTAAFVGNIASIYPEARHKFKAMEAIDAYADAMGTPPKVIASNDEVQEILAAEAEAAQQQLAMEQMSAVSDSAKNLSDIDTSGSNVAADLLRGTLGET